MIQDTSLSAWDSIQSTLTAKQKKVLDALRQLPDATNEELRVILGWTINRVTGRTKELRDKGLVVNAGKRKCHITGSTAHAWKAKIPVLPPARDHVLTAPPPPVRPKPVPMIQFRFTHTCVACGKVADFGQVMHRLDPQSVAIADLQKIPGRYWGQWVCEGYGCLQKLQNQ